jgi:nuclear pore complex protein Nup62
MSAFSFTSAVAIRPALAAKAVKASVSTKVNAIGGFGPNMPADEYKKKMAAKKAEIESNKAKGSAKSGGFSFGKKAVAPAPAAKTGGFSFGKKAAAPAPAAKTGGFSFAKPAFAKKETAKPKPAAKPTKMAPKPAALSSFGAGLPGRRQVAGAASAKKPVEAKKSGFSLFGK